MSKQLEISALTPSLGAEINGVDVSRLDDATFDQIQQALLDFKVIFLREQSIDLDCLEVFSQRFGELMQLPYIEPLKDHPNIIRVLKTAEEINMGVFGGDWHSDFSFLEEPPKMSILYAQEIPPIGGDTLWIDMAQALRALPVELQQKLAGRSTIHLGAPYGVKHAPAADSQFKGSIKIERNNADADQETRHPAICRHPETGQTMLFINPTYTTRIDGYSEIESRSVLEQLYQHYTRPEFACRFKWSANTIALWDNRNTLHYAVNDYDGYRRCLYRTTIKGCRPEAS